MKLSTCPPPAALFALVDEDDASEDVRTHVAECDGCAKRLDDLRALTSTLRASVRSDDAAETVRWLEARLAEEVPADTATHQRRSPARRRAHFVGVGAVTLLAAAAALSLVPRLHHDDQGTFSARGGHMAPGPRRDVELQLDAIRRRPEGTTLVTLSDASTTSDPSPGFLLSYATVGARASSFVLCFAVDREGTIHWLYPAYESADEDPVSVELPPGRLRQPLDTEAWFEHLPSGSLAIHAIVSAAPQHVSAVESLHGEDLEASALAARFPGSDVRTWVLDVEP